MIDAHKHIINDL